MNLNVTQVIIRFPAPTEYEELLSDERKQLTLKLSGDQEKARYTALVQGYAIQVSLMTDQEVTDAL